MQDDWRAIAQRGLAEAMEQMAQRCGGTVCKENGLLLVAGNHPCPVLVNSALRLGDMDAEEVLRRAEKFFASVGNYWETWIREGEDGDLEQAAMAAGMRVAAELSGMMLWRMPEMPEMAASIDCVRF